MAELVLVRHGKSEWNEKGLWTGWTYEVPLCKKGVEEVRSVGKAIKDIDFSVVYVAPLIRNLETLEIIKEVLNKPNLEIVESREILERNYGIYTGKNKWQVKEEVGEKEFIKIRRGWDYPISEGESLKEVYERFVPYYKFEIEPRLKKGENVLIISSGNALRSLVKYLENVDDEAISEIEIGTAEAWKYKLDLSGKIIKKEILNNNPNKLKV